MKSKNNKLKFINSRFLLAFAVITLGYTACKEDKPDTPDTSLNGKETYAIFWRVDAPDGRTNYVSIVNDITKGELDPAKGIEVSGKSRFFAPEKAGYFIVADGEDLTFTRYNITKGGTSIEKGGKFSMANEGVTSFQKRNVFLSATKAYYIDNTQGQIVIWNPETMTITSSFDLPPEFADGYQGFSTQLGFGKYQLDNNRLIIPVGWVNFAAKTHLNKTGLAIVDVDADIVLSYSEDTTCALAVSGAFMDNGDVYFGVSERYHFSDEARKKADCGCILKVPAGSNTFDTTYNPYFMNQIPNYRVGMGLSNSPKANHGYVKVLDTTKLAWSENVPGGDYYGLVWFTYEINLPENKIVGKVNRPLAPSYAENLYTFNNAYYGAIKLNDNNEDYKVVKYFEDGTYIEGLKAPGYISNMQRIQ